MSDQRKLKSFVDVMLTPLRVFDQRKSKSLVKIMLTPLHSVLHHKSTRRAIEQPLHLLKICNVIPGYWSKASKCKKLLRHVQDRLKLLKDKRYSILQQSRHDAALLLICGKHLIANKRAAEIFKDESMLEVYDLLDAFCEVIILNLPYIQKQRDCPIDINEAASTLVYASVRCEGLPELRKLRNLFGERYGQEFNMTALDLLPGNLVNLTVKENLSRRSVSNDARNKILDEISSSLQVKHLPLEYTPEPQQQPEIPDNNNLTILQESLRNDSKIIPEEGIPVVHSGYEEPNVHDSKVSKNEGNEEGNKSPSSLNYPKKPFPIESHKEVGLFKDSTSEEAVYLDDIEELKYSICRDGDIIQDQSIFHFKLSNIPTKRKSSYSRAASMPPERPKTDQSDSILRSSSFPLEHSTNYWINAPRSPHVHPKLPEYDDIVEQFMALKEAALQKKCMEERSNSFRFQHSTNHWNNAPCSPQFLSKLPEYDDVAVQSIAIEIGASQKKSPEGKKQLLLQNSH